MTVCPQARGSRSACVRNSSTSRRPAPACCWPISSGSTISAASVSRAFGLATQSLPRGCRRDFRYPAMKPGWCSIPRTFTSTPTAFWSRASNGQDRQPEGLVPGAAGVSGGGVLGHPAADDGGQLFDAGYLRQQPVLLERRRLVQGIARSVDRSRRAVLCLAVAQFLFLRGDSCDRGAARDRGRAVDAARRLDGRGLPRDPGAAAPHSMERGRHHLADLWAAGHRAAGLCAESYRAELQLRLQRSGRLGHRDRDGRLALDQPGGAVVLRRAEIDPRRLLSGGPDRRRVALGGVHRDPAAEDESRAVDRGVAALHGQLHDLHRAVRGDGGRAGQFDDVHFHRARQDRARAIRPRQGRSPFAGLQPDHHHRLLGVLYRHDQCRRRAPRHQGSRMMHSIPRRRLILSLFLIFLLLPIYWLVNMSFKTNSEIVTTMTLWPHQPTIANYMRIFTDESWYSGYINSLKYVIINTIISISVALPAAYAFSRYRFLGDKHLFFWLLSNRMAPAAVYALPFFNLYSAINLFDTPWAVALAHCIFNVPLAVWILEGFVSGVPREIDETAFLDGYSFPKFFVKILVPLIASGIGVAAFFCFMFSWVELLLARTLTAVDAKPISAVMTRTVAAAGMDWGLLAAAGVLTIIPGALVIWFVRNYIARGFALGRV